jgi:hypothetical protein
MTESDKSPAAKSPVEVSGRRAAFWFLGFFGGMFIGWLALRTPAMMAIEPREGTIFWTLWALGLVACAVLWATAYMVMTGTWRRIKDNGEDLRWLWGRGAVLGVAGVVACAFVAGGTEAVFNLDHATHWFKVPDEAEKWPVATDAIGIVILKTTLHGGIRTEEASVELIQRAERDGKILWVDGLLRLRELPMNRDDYTGTDFVYAEILGGRHSGKAAYFSKKYAERMR